jgi:hypothetical protein
VSDGHLVVASDLIRPSRRAGSGRASPTVDQAEPGRPMDAPAYEITPPALFNQSADPMKPAVGHVKWLVAALAIRRSHCQRYARQLHVTTKTWSDRELRPHQAKPVADRRLEARRAVIGQMVGPNRRGQFETIRTGQAGLWPL